MINKNKIFILASRPFAHASQENFKLIETDLPNLQDGQVLIKSKYISVDPYMRGKMSEAKSYTEPYKLNEPVSGAVIGEVIESKTSELNKGDMVKGNLNWQVYHVISPVNLTKLDSTVLPVSANLGVLGMPGLTAYFGLLDIGRPDLGETVVISGAAGAVGTTVGQIAKIMGCRVVGLTGTDDKTTYLKELGFDEAINYKTVSNLRKAIRNSCPQGVDIYFDNVGGEISDSVLFLINNFARIVLCGQISQYNVSRMPVGPRMQSIMLTRRALMQGFIVSDYKKHHDQALTIMKKWYNSERLKHKETILKGFENIPEAFFGLFRGDNIGKMIVEVE